MNVNATLIIEVASFLILLVFLIKVLYRPVLDLLDKRAEEIKKSNQKIKADLVFAENERSRAEQILTESKHQALKIKEKMSLDAEEARQKIISQTKEEAKRMLNTSQQEISHEIKKAKEKIKDEIIDLSFREAEQILRRQFTPKDQEQLIKDLTEELTDGRGTAGG